MDDSQNVRNGLGGLRVMSPGMTPGGIIIVDARDLACVPEEISLWIEFVRNCPNVTFVYTESQLEMIMRHAPRYDFRVQDIFASHS